MDIFKAKEVVKMFSDPIQIIFLLGLAALLGMVISWTYHRTHKGFSYSQSFANTLILMTVITTLIIMVIGDNIARAIGIFGAFSIVRFRTSVKDTRDTAFIFFALAIGLAVGTGSLAIGITGTIALSILIFALYHGNFAGPKKLDYVLNFKMDSKDHADNIFKTIFAKHLKTETLLNVESKDRGNHLVFTFNIGLKNKDSLKEFLNELNQLKGISDVNVVSSKNDLEF
ncbi:MAG: DUF4956 domain-containing protein [Candidatus Peregrinibacteria bacterium]|nr:DUF4956 domain-containing protein [Candidatus Peregrinibacteria bacterium]